VKKFLPLVLGSCLLLPGMAYPVGLGAININSNLNQPLKANIRLLSLRNVEPDEIQAVLASPEQFKRVNIDNSPVLGLLTIDIAKDPRGRPMIRIFSKEPISEPYLQVLLDVKWPNGQMLRAYNVLLDPIDYVVAASTTPAPKPLLKMASLNDPKVQTDAPAAFVESEQQIDDISAESINEDIAKLEKKIMSKKMLVQVQAHQARLNDIEKSPLLNTKGNASTLEKTLRAELALSVEASSIAREENEIMAQQLTELKDKNQQLLAELSQQNKQIQILKLEVSQQTNEPADGPALPSEKNGMISVNFLIASLIMLVSGSTYAWYRRYYRKPVSKPIDLPSSVQAVNEPLIETKRRVVEPTRKAPLVPTPLANKDKPAIVVTTQPKREENVTKHPEGKTIEFETGLYDKNKLKDQKIKDNDPPDIKPKSASTAALSTSSIFRRKLALAKHHIKVQDFQEAYLVLTEIVDEGDEDLAKEAQALLDQLDR